jgi:uncharacterized phage-associated protein
MALGTKSHTPTSAMNVAGMILLAAQERGIGRVTARKLQKLLYFTQLYHLGLKQSLAFNENLKLSPMSGPNSKPGVHQRLRLR